VIDGENEDGDLGLMRRYGQDEVNQDWEESEQNEVDEGSC